MVPTPHVCDQYLGDVSVNQIDKTVFGDHVLFVIQNGHRYAHNALTHTHD